MPENSRIDIPEALCASGSHSDVQHLMGVFIKETLKLEMLHFGLCASKLLIGVRCLYVGDLLVQDLSNYVC